ncbi:MAG: mandelate racemase/muconate lactonizing enzyme family protein [Pirellulales bacterium]
MRRQPLLNRRSLLASAGAAAAGQVLLQDMLSAQENPAEQVADRAAGIKITSLRPTILGPKVFIKVETNHGVTGWGEIDQLEPKTASALATSLFELLDGENPTRIEYLWQKLYRAHRDMRGGPFMVHTIAGIDMALWDIAGKLWQTPVYRLLGGPTRDKIRVYPSPKASKAGAGPGEFSATPAEIQRHVDYIKQTRQQVGPDGAVMFDAHCALPPPHLIQLAAAIQPYDVLFIEEPAVPGNIEVFKRLKQAINIPLATGERDRTIWEMLPYLQERCIDILQPDCAHTGGISQMRKIAALAEAFFVPLAPHCVTTELGVTASLHAAASIPFFVIHEYYPQITPPGLLRKSWSVNEEGYASLPQGVGLGVEIDEAKLEELSKLPPAKWEWPTRGRLADGSISDY